MVPDFHVVVHGLITTHLHCGAAYAHLGIFRLLANQYLFRLERNICPYGQAIGKSAGWSQ